MANREMLKSALLSHTLKNGSQYSYRYNIKNITVENLVL